MKADFKHFVYEDQKGFVLPVGLMFLAILGIIAATASLVTTIDLRIAMNYKTGTQAFYEAMTGYKEALSRLPDIRQTGMPDPDWRGFIGDTTLAETAFGYVSSDSIVPNLSGSSNYAVMVRHKIDDKKNVLLWGDNDKNYINEENLVTGIPIEMIRSHGTVGGSLKIITIEARGRLPYFHPPAAFYVNGDLDKLDVEGHVEGDWNPFCASVPDIMTTVNASPGKEATDWPAGYSDRPKSESFINGYSTIYPVIEVLASLAVVADNLIPPGTYSTITWGSDGDIQITYCEGNLDLKNINGNGILAVNGNLDLREDINWKGLIVVSGETVLHDSGYLSIYGAIITDNKCTMDGQPDVYYDCMVFQNLEKNLIHYTISSWLEDF